MDYSISIGIDDYLHLSSTIYAENDAREFHRIMKDVFGIKNQKLLLGHQTTYLNVQKNINQIISNMSEYDRLFFFFAGHGINYKGSPFITGYDTMVDNIEGSCHDISKILGDINSKGCKQCIFFIDACESTISFNTRNIHIRDFSIEDIKEMLTSNDYTYVFSAASEDGTASIIEEQKHGIWSYYLLEALEGKAQEALVESTLTNNSLQNYLSLSVENYCKDHPDNEQKCHVWGKAQNEFIIMDFSCRSSSRKNQILIEKLFFGIIDADNEYKESSETFKKNYYDLNNIVKELIVNKRQYLVLGKKGTGKTYIGKYLEEKSIDNPNFIAKYIHFQNFDYVRFDTIKETKAQGYERYRTAWEYLLFIYLASLVVGDESIKELPEHEELSFLLSSHASSAFPPFRRIISPRLKRGIPLDSSFQKYIGLDDGGSNTHYKLTDVVELLDILLNNVPYQTGKQYFLILDGLDEKITDRDIYKDALNSLLWTVNDLNNQFHESKLPLKIVVFLRNDVYQFVAGSNINKLSFGNTIHLNWINDSDDKHDYPLCEFISLRINNSVTDNGGTSLEHPLKRVLPKRMNNGTDPWEWLLDFTTYKPRDVIEFLNSCKVLCNNNEDRLTDNIMWNALKRYSGYLLGEFKDELYGFISDDGIKELFEKILPKLGKNKISYITIKTEINKSRYLREYGIDELLSNLYSCGVLGVIDSNGFVHWGYRTKTIKTISMENCKFVIHNGLWKVLSFW